VSSEDADIHVDEEISACLNLDNPKSFFLFAGAGSGKTRSLVTTLSRFRDLNAQRLKLQRRRVGVITYTNAASEEISRRLQFDPLIQVSTIHSFVWELISNLHSDIKQWLDVELKKDIEELTEQQSRGRAGSAAARERAQRIESKRMRLANLASIKQFTYSPTGDFRGRDALNHTEVIQIGASFLLRRPLMQSILVGRYPVLLIDESQDTNKLLMDALLEVQNVHRERFLLGLFGDMMQRIYSDGKERLGEGLPADWATPTKVMNHRCPKRVVKLINQIRSAVDAQRQLSPNDKDEGVARLFVLSNKTTNKADAERLVREKMSQITGDQQWQDLNAVKTLMLEHLMAARRLGFVELFQPLYEAGGGALQTSLREGTLPGLKLFSDLVSPLRMACERGDEFVKAAIVRQNSPLLKQLVNKTKADSAQMFAVEKARNAVDRLFQLWDKGNDPSLKAVLQSLISSGLFEIPDSLRAWAAASEGAAALSGQSQSGDPVDELVAAWNSALSAPFSQVERYASYVGGTAPFATHQGIKGLEFPRVVVVMDDTEARGFMFSYEKLFGAVPKSDTDVKNEQEGKETSLDRTRRLLYVTCSRAERSLALVAYSISPASVREHAMDKGWFADDEIIEI
jgi:DNA helicase-2/ATP-dependent DNA helicase PcrA